MSDAPDQAADMLSMLSRRVAAARRASGLTFDQLAAVSGVSKGVLVRIEQGGANPSIATLCRLASGLKLSVAQLVEPGETPDAAVRIVMPDQARRLWKGPEGGWAQLEAGTHGPDMLELWTWELHPGERFTAQAHSPGAREIIRVLSGALRLEVGGVSHVLQAATAAVARTDRPHSYACAGAAPVRFTMVVHEPPSSAP